MAGLESFSTNGSEVKGFGKSRKILFWNRHEQTLSRVPPMYTQMYVDIGG